jgi:hypothetical protein
MIDERTLPADVRSGSVRVNGKSVDGPDEHRLYFQRLEGSPGPVNSFKARIGWGLSIYEKENLRSAVAESYGNKYTFADLLEL